jgi:hypothetical protein
MTDRGSCKCQRTNWTIPSPGIFRGEWRLYPIQCKIYREGTENRDRLKWSSAFLMRDKIRDFPLSGDQNKPDQKTSLHRSRGFLGESTPR